MYTSTLFFFLTLHTAEGGTQGYTLFIIYSMTAVHAHTRFSLITDRGLEGKHEILHIRTHTHTYTLTESQGDVFVFRDLITLRRLHRHTHTHMIITI